VRAASANSNGTLEVWIDNIGTAGTKIATIPVSSTGGTDAWKTFSSNVSVSGQHDLYFKFIGPANVFRLNDVRFLASDTVIAGTNLKESMAVELYPNPFSSQGINIRHKGQFSFQISDLTGLLLEA